MAAVQPIRKQSFERVFSLLKTAIFQKSCVSARYAGYRRLLSPHILGRAKEGTLQLLAYQYGGESRSGLSYPGSPDNWRCIAIEKLSEVELNEDHWHTPTNHSRPQKCVVTVFYDANIPSTLIDPVDFVPER